RQQVDTGSRFGVVPTDAQRNGDFSGSLTPNGQNLGQTAACIGAGNPTFVSPSSCVSAGRTPALLVPKGYPGAGSVIPGGNIGPYMTPLGKTLVNLYPKSNYSQ